VVPGCGTIVGRGSCSAPGGVSGVVLDGVVGASVGIEYVAGASSLALRLSRRHPTNVVVAAISVIAIQ
jgi:hypothetical protein